MVPKTANQKHRHIQLKVRFIRSSNDQSHSSDLQFTNSKNDEKTCRTEKTAPTTPQKSVHKRARENGGSAQKMRLLRSDNQHQKMCRRMLHTSTKKSKNQHRDDGAAEEKKDHNFFRAQHSSRKKEHLKRSEKRRETRPGKLGTPIDWKSCREKAKYKKGAPDYCGKVGDVWKTEKEQWHNNHQPHRNQKRTGQPLH
ncbi:unnamed protein product [Caenorhabditis angaria]|uniref:Uncharacterized protein n=1 Tax=Caenorhabditis angaria TaxID=860376 RepID=A0A9P1MZX6_9PELO|nr:unnamed protein product [Caenorhabditis angaria]